MRTYLKLFTALSFFKIKSPDLFWFQWIYPIIFCITLQIIFWLLPSKPHIFGDAGIVNSTNGLLNTLIGFYLAALAAIASFPNNALDLNMKGRTPEIYLNRGGKKILEKLTRRRFLCILFGYCTFVSIFIYFLGVISSFLLPSLLSIPFFIKWKYFFKFGWLSIYLFLSSSLLITTLLGLHYLVDRMHRD
jgi:hypothetical protein